MLVDRSIAVLAMLSRAFYGSFKFLDAILRKSITDWATLRRIVRYSPPGQLIRDGIAGPSADTLSLDE